MPRVIFNNPNFVRDDHAERYGQIKEAYGQFTGKTLIDIGCANSYFIKRFLEDGGASAVGLEPNTYFQGGHIIRDISEASGPFDICFYLDLHYHDGINYFPWIKENVETLFAAPSGVGNNGRLEQDLIKEFGNLQFVGTTNYANRNIYKVRIK